MAIFGDGLNLFGTLVLTIDTLLLLGLLVAGAVRLRRQSRRRFRPPTQPGPGHQATEPGS